MAAAEDARISIGTVTTMPFAGDDDDDDDERAMCVCCGLSHRLLWYVLNAQNEVKSVCLCK